MSNFMVCLSLRDIIASLIISTGKAQISHIQLFVSCVDIVYLHTDFVSMRNVDKMPQRSIKDNSTVTDHFASRFDDKFMDFAQLLQ